MNVRNATTPSRMAEKGPLGVNPAYGHVDSIRGVSTQGTPNGLGYDTHLQGEGVRTAARSVHFTAVRTRRLWA